MTTRSIEELVAKGQAARNASRGLARLSSRVKDRALLNIADALETEQARVLEANQQDYRAGQSDGLGEALLDRLLLTADRLRGMARDV